VVALAIPRSFEMMIGLLAILKAGGAYLPLDPDYPQDRLRYMLSDSGARVLLLGEREIRGLEDYDGTVVRLDETLASQPVRPLACSTTGDNLAYIIYTSGSTGRPKGAMNSHRAIANRLLWMQAEYGITADDRVLQKTPLSFDVSVWELFWPLITGARLVIARPEGHKDGAYLVELIREQKITTLHFVPSMLRIWLEQRELSTCRSLRRVICSGEALTLEHQERFFARLAPQLDTELHNLYGPTEAAVDVTFWACRRQDSRGTVPIGHPVANTQIQLLDRELRPVPVGIPGELYIGGVQLARGYHGRPDLTAEKFVADPWNEGGRLYRTGDLARRLPDGAVEYIGRIDHQIKLRGFRIELGEIEAVLRRLPGVKEALVLVREDVPGDKALVAYLVAPLTGEARPGHGELARFGRQSLPDHMIPAHFVWLEELPLLPNGKVDRRALPAPAAARPDLDVAFAAAKNDTEQKIVAIWQEVLRLPKVGAEDNFFDLGGHSLLLVQVQNRVQEAFGREIPVVELFRHSTARSLARFLEGKDGKDTKDQKDEARATEKSSAVAVIGLAGRFPGSRDLEDFWEKLHAGTELISFFSEEELVESGVEPALLARPGYVRAKAMLDGADLFDAGFFGYTPREAEILDPQQRLFLEAAWEALENAGYDAQRSGGKVGVFAGQSFNTYLLENLWPNRHLMEAVGLFQTVLGNDKDYLATRTSYKLGLRGPSVNVQTACSTSLVAVHLACRSLLDGDCDMALAGGVSVGVPTKSGYLHQTGSIVSPDGHCAAFDVSAQGTVPGNGLGLVVLKRLDDALRDGDTIRAIIRGSAINNDGPDKVGFTAPSVDGQVEVISDALKRAGVGAETIGYVEAHGTGTPMGDPIEVAALTRVFRQSTDAVETVALGTLKSNLGHMDAAAGVAGLIKAVLALEHGAIPPSLHFQAPNPALGLETSPFYVNNHAVEWPRNGHPRRAGVSSFGIGGTNAHVIVEEAPAVAPSVEETDRPHLLVLSAQTPTALEAQAARLAEHLRRSPQVSLADIAWTLQAGRRVFPVRQALVVHDREDAIATLSGANSQRVWDRFEEGAEPSVAFLFPGQGAQHAGMAAGLYAAEPGFRRRVDECAVILAPRLGMDLRELLYPEPARKEEAQARLERTAFAQPALFTIEYALAGLWMDRGIRPAAMLGHSVGEFIAATLAGVMELPDALELVALRGRLIDALPEGAMLSVELPESELAGLLGPDLSLAAVNGPSSCVVAGDFASIDALAQSLAAQGIVHRRLHTSHAFHSATMDAAMQPFADAVGRLDLQHPKIPYVSGMTGTWITARQATDPWYWARHLRETVRFADGVRTLAEGSGRVLLEVGPGSSLTSLSRRQLGEGSGVTTISSLPHPKDRATDLETVAGALGRLWLCGARVDWRAVHGPAQRRRVPLPSYPFERQRYWIEAPRQGASWSAAEPVATNVQPSLTMHEGPRRSRSFESPETEIEEVIAEVWQELLGIERVGRNDGFFDLGGHSLSAVQLIARLQERLPVDLPADVLFDRPTVAALAELVEAQLLDRLEEISDTEAEQWTAGA
jgi:amino acid adenylation domain-containing protein